MPDAKKTKYLFVALLLFTARVRGDVGAAFVATTAQENVSPSNLSPADRQRDLATLYVSILFQEEAARSNLDRVAWLNAGVMEMAAAEMNARQHFISYVDQVKTWKEIWQKKLKILSLARLRKSSELMTNQVRQGSRPVAALCALAARDLSELNGLSAFKAFYRGLKTRSDVETLFQEVFGKALADFEQNFIQMLTNP